MNNLALAVVFAIALILVLSPWLNFILCSEKQNCFVMTAVPIQANGLTVSETEYLLMRSVEALKQVSKARRVLRTLEQDLNMAAAEAPASFW